MISIISLTRFDELQVPFGNFALFYMLLLALYSFELT